jgi:hypothetical protein
MDVELGAFHSAGIKRWLSREYRLLKGKRGAGSGRRGGRVSMVGYVGRCRVRQPGNKRRQIEFPRRVSLAAPPPHPSPGPSCPSNGRSRRKSKETRRRSHSRRCRVGGIARVNQCISRKSGPRVPAQGLVTISPLPPAP